MQMLNRLAAAAIALLLAAPALAQTNPHLTQDQKLTPAQWNNLFASKQDTLGYTPLNQAGGVMTGRLVTTPPGAATSGFSLTPGTTPASPVSGDLWITSSGFFARINGVTIGPLSGATSSSFGNTSPLTLSFPSGVVTYACPTCGVTGSPLSQFASTTSAQLAGIVSDETGSGALVFGTSPSLVTPNLGTPSAAVLTHATGLPISTGLAGAGTGVQTALGVNIGSAGAFVVNGGALGTPSSGTIAAGISLGGVTMTLGSDATGDIYYRNSSGVLTRLAAGANGTALELVSGIPSWQPVSGTGTVTSVSQGQGITLSSSPITTTGTVSIDQTAWTAFTPSPTGSTFTFTVNSARFKTLGKSTFVEIDLSLGTVTSAPNSFSFTLPNTANSAGAIPGTEIATSGISGACRLGAASANAICTGAAGAPYVTGQRFVFSGVYENQ